VIYKNNWGSFAKIRWWLWFTVTYSFDSGRGSIWTAHLAMDGGRWLRATKRRDRGPAAALGGALQGFPPIATISLGNTTNSVAIEGYYCTETVIRLQFGCLLQHKVCVAIFIFCVTTS
jgi:hypothetical protein